MPRRYRVEITEPAKLDVAAIHDVIANDKPRAAAKWARTIEQKVRSLKSMPMLYEVIPEAEDLGYPYRHLIWGNYRIIYKVEEHLVTVVRVFHAARLLKPRHLEE